MSDRSEKRLIVKKIERKSKKAAIRKPVRHISHPKRKSGRSRYKTVVKPLTVITRKYKSNKTAQNFHCQVHRRVIGKSGENRPIKSILIGQGKDTILFIASIHGNEKAGTPIIWRLAGYLANHPGLLRGRKVILLPMVNPDGGNHNSRYNAHGVDLNRNFATANRVNSRRHGGSALSEPETRAIVRVIRQCKPDRIVVFHQSLTCIDYDGPARDLALHMAKYCDLPVRKLGAMPGSLGSYAGLGLNIPTITFELPAGIENLDSEILWKLYGPALIASIMYPHKPDLIQRTEFMPYSGKYIRRAK